MNTQDELFHPEEFKNHIKGLKIDTKKTSGTCTSDQSTKVIEEICTILKLDFNDKTHRSIAFVLTAAVCQKGGTNKNVKITTASQTIGEHTLSVKTLREICEKHKITPRQWARFNATQIYKVSAMLDIEGDLARQMKLYNPNITRDQEYWASNFQTQNPECDDQVRKWLIETRNEKLMGKD